MARSGAAQKRLQPWLAIVAISLCWLSMAAQKPMSMLLLMPGQSIIWHVGAAKLHALLFAVGLHVAAANVVHCCSHSFFQRLWLYFACCADVLSTCSHTLAAMRVAPVQSVGIVFLSCVYTQMQHFCQRYVIATPYKSIGTSRFSHNHTSSRLGLPFKVKSGLNMKASCIRRQLSKSIRWQTVFSAAQIILSFALVWRLGAIGESTLLP